MVISFPAAAATFAVMSFNDIVQTRRGAGVELVLFFVISMLPLKLPFIILSLVFIAIASMKARKLKWAYVGFSAADFNTKNIAIGVALACVYFLLFNYLVTPVLSQWLPPANLNAMSNIKGDVRKLITWLFITWIIGAVFEELIFRGYLINRLQDVFGTRPAAQVVIVVLAAIPFAGIHYYQGMRGIITAGIFGIFQSIVYIIKNKKLATPMIAHGTFDTIGFTRLFFAKIV